MFYFYLFQLFKHFYPDISINQNKKNNNLKHRHMETVPENNGFLIRKETFIKKNDSKIQDVYHISKNPLGKGAYGVVSKCTHRTTK